MLLWINWKGLHKRLWKGPATLLSWTKTREKWLLEFLLKKWVFIKLMSEVLEKNIIYCPHRSGKPCWRQAALPSTSPWLQESDSSPRACWGCPSSHSHTLANLPSSIPIFQTNLTFTEWEKRLSSACFCGKLALTLDYMNTSNPYLGSFITFWTSLLNTTTHRQPVTATHVCAIATLLFANQYFKVIYSINPVSYLIKLPFSSTQNVMLIS